MRASCSSTVASIPFCLSAAAADNPAAPAPTTTTFASKITPSDTFADWSYRRYDIALRATEMASFHPTMLTRASRLGNIRTLIVVGCVASFIQPSVARAQHLRDRISDLFIFGPGQQPLFLAGSGDPNNPAALQAHGLHFIPSSNAENG